MKKSKFKKGDLVKHKHGPDWGVGEVIRVDESGPAIIKVNWSGRRWPVWGIPENLEPAETPIQRMRRLYSED